MKPNNRVVDTSYLPVNWRNKPDNVRAYTTLITGGYSAGGYHQFNLATHVGDDLSAVCANRTKLREDLDLPSEPLWLDQVHSNKVIVADEKMIPASGEMSSTLQADASTTKKTGVVCVVLTADCLPVFFSNKTGTEVAVAHAGWRGLHQGVLTNTINAMQSPGEEIMASMGPAIGPEVFEVGAEVKAAFVEKSDVNSNAFKDAGKDHYLFDIYQLARNELQLAGVNDITGGGYCTYSEKHRFYSYRRSNNTGRMASLIWLI